MDKVGFLPGGKAESDKRRSVPLWNVHQENQRGRKEKRVGEGMAYPLLALTELLDCV
jgi:hypothetical protein